MITSSVQKRLDVAASVIMREAGWGGGPQGVARAAPETVNALRVRSAEPVTAWETGPVTPLAPGGEPRSAAGTPEAGKLTAVQLRRARVGDEQAVADVHVRSWQVGYRGLVADDYLDGLHPDDRAGHYTFDVDDPVTIVAVTDRIRGFATLSPGAGELMALYVDPDSWGTGLGRALIAETERRIAPRHTVAALWVLAGNTRARRFYEAAGWQPDGSERRDRVWGAVLDEVGYRKPLEA